MKTEISEELIRNYLLEIDVPIVGFTKPFCDDQLTIQLKKHKKENHYIYFGETPIEQRQRIEAVFPLCKDVIVIGIPYECRNKEKENISSDRLGFVSNMAWEFDYHHLVKEKLLLLEGYLKILDETLECVMQVDTGPLIDRHIAYQSGIGNYAKNQCLMNDQYGTEFYIGYLLIDREINRNQEEVLTLHASPCNECNLCVRCCPGQVLSDDFEFEGPLCISYLTQKKEHLSWSERVLIGDSIYGCDRCQLVCPQNKEKPIISGDYQRKTKNSIDVIEFLEMSNKKIIRLYKETGFAWRGAKILKRNAIIALGNKKNKKNILFLEKLLESDNEYHRPYILWALYQSGDDKIGEKCLEISQKYLDELTQKECFDILQIVK